MKHKLTHIALLFFSLGLLMGCEEDITLDLPQGEELIVVEGQIEQGNPPFVLLTRTMPYFSSTAISDFDNMFVEGAEVKISDGSKTVDLFEINFKTLTDSVKKVIVDLLQISADDIEGFNYVIYTTPFMLGEEGKQYTLTVDKDQHHLTATTSIPYAIKIDSVWSEQHENPDFDSFYYYTFSFQDIPNQENFFRVFTQRNDEAFYTNLFASLFDDKFRDGEVIQLPLLRGDSKFASIQRETFGAFKLGDSVTVKFCHIDKAHYNFWSTFSTDQFSGGPFASPVNIESNVEGGLGVWGGYGAYYYSFVVE
jgi:hypothetical protein